MTEKPDNQEATKIFKWWVKRNKLVATALFIGGLLTGGIGLLAFPLMWLTIRSGVGRDNEDSATYQYRNRNDDV